MDTPLVVILFVILAVNAVILWRMFRGQRGEDKAPSDGLLLIQSQFSELNRGLSDLTKTLDSKLIENSRELHQSLQFQSSESTKIIRDITERLTRLDETNKQVVSFADQLQSLQDILKNPKQRGVLGEYYLETLLKNVLPPGSYQMQYAFTDGTIVDAAVFVKDKVIPIDSKFSLENYNKLVEEKNPAEKERLEKLFVSDLKNRIVETAKYIQPEKNTMDFAFMFIPHEAIYYDLLINKVGALKEETENLIQRAASKYKVIIVSPTSFLAYLQTVLQGLKAMQIEDTAQDIVKRVGELGKHLKNFEEYHSKLGNALGTAVNQFNASRKEFSKVDKDVMRIAGSTIGIEPLQVDKPLADE